MSAIEPIICPRKSTPVVNLHQLLVIPLPGILFTFGPRPWSRQATMNRYPFKFSFEKMNEKIISKMKNTKLKKKFSFTLIVYICVLYEINKRDDLSTLSSFTLKTSIFHSTQNGDVVKGLKKGLEKKVAVE